jgi:glucose/arabinose dehydrogenase
VRRLFTTLVLIAALLALGLPACGSASQQPSEPSARGKRGVALKKVGEFDHPVYVTGAPGFPKLLFVVEQPGRVMVLKNGRPAGTFLDLRNRVGYDGGERGLLSIAFPPDYRERETFYAYFNDRAGTIRVAAFRRQNAIRSSAESERTVLAIPHPVNANHNGGQMQFLDNLLYIGTGDGGSGGDPPNNAQNLDSLLGKVLRIDPRLQVDKPYQLPPSNPFLDGPGRAEIYSYGLRNPFRFSFDTVSAKQPRIVIGDVGQNQFEELDYTTVATAGGANFGWDALEGFAPYTDENSGTPDPGGTVKPIFAYPHSRGNSCSIIGGYVVADRSLPALYKRYVYADFCEGQLRSLVPHLKGASDDRKLGLAVENPTSFGEDGAHHLYVSSLSGQVYRLIQR